MSRSLGRRPNLLFGTAVAATVAMGVLVAPTATAQPEEPGPSSAQWADAATAPIRPGVQMITDNAVCTSNFVYTSGERVFLGQAAHCSAAGSEVTEFNGCEVPSLPLGTPVTIRAFDGTERAGTLAYNSWIAMQEVGETDEDVCLFNDFALVEIDPADVGDVNPTVPVFGGPSGLNTEGTTFGERIANYGNSPLRQGVTALRPKTGFSLGQEGDGFTHLVVTINPGVGGDSGSGFLDSQGRAFGSLSTGNVAPAGVPVSNAQGATDIASAMGYASSLGGFSAFDLEPGTEPFDPTVFADLSPDLGVEPFLPQLPVPVP